MGVSNVGWITGGPWAGRKCIGCSLAVGADAGIPANGPYGVDAQESIVLEVELTRRTVTVVQVKAATAQTPELDPYSAGLSPSASRRTSLWNGKDAARRSVDRQTATRTCVR